MAHSRTLLLRDVRCKIVFILILHLFVTLWDFASPETGGLVELSPQSNKLITDFIYFKTVSCKTSDVYRLARLSCCHLSPADGRDNNTSEVIYCLSYVATKRDLCMRWRLGV